MLVGVRPSPNSQAIRARDDGLRRVRKVTWRIGLLAAAGAAVIGAKFAHLTAVLPHLSTDGSSSSSGTSSGGTSSGGSSTSGGSSSQGGSTSNSSNSGVSPSSGVSSSSGGGVSTSGGS